MSLGGCSEQLLVEMCHHSVLACCTWFHTNLDQWLAEKA